MGRLNPGLLVPVRHLGSPCAADDDLSAAYAARDMLAESWNYADLKTKPLAKVQFARILDLCMNPEMKGMAGAEVLRRKKGLSKKVTWPMSSCSIATHRGSQQYKKVDDTLDRITY